MTRTFPAKLLLFGEYTVLNGSQALACPVDIFHGEWKSGGVSGKIPFDVRKWIAHLKAIGRKNPAFSKDNIRQLEEDMHNGFFYASNIPVGYGLGSSGAFCAAVFDRYFKQEDLPIDILQGQLAQLEAFFHGRSSGMDPLVSYLGKPVIKIGDTYQTVEVPARDPKLLSIGLLDAKKPRKTADLVGSYLRGTGKNSLEIRTISHYVNTAIHSFIRGQWALVQECVHLISAKQWLHFRDMIPEGMRGAWHSSLGLEHTSIKLCGAGGGGYFLIFTQTQAGAESLFSGYGITWVGAEITT